MTCLLFFILLWLSPSFRNKVIAYFSRIEHFLTRNKKTIVIAVVGLYIAITVFLQFRHSLDGDESQAWLIARDSPSLWKMYSQMGYEGSPGLWHTILFPLAKSGVPFQIMYFLNHFFAVVAIFIWLRFAPFPLFVRLLLPFIHIFLTQYSINARSYALSICLLFAALALYKEYYNKWLLWSLAFFLFANTTIHAALLTCGFTFFLFLNWIFLKNKTDGKAVLVIAAGIVLVCVQVYPPEDLARELAAFKFQASLSHLLVGVITGIPFLSIFIYLALLVQVMLSVKNRFPLYGLLATQLALFFLFFFKYQGELRHHFYLMLSIIMFLWAGAIKEKRKNELCLFLFIILFMMVTTAGSWAMNLAGKFSEWGKEMAHFINNQIQPDSTTFMACYPGNLSSGVLPYMHIKSVYMPDENKWGSFTTWDQQRVSGIFNPNIVQNVANLAGYHAGYKKYYYLTIYELPEDSVKYYHIELLKKTTNQYKTSQWRTIYLYKLPEK
jgi:hypothetical protein